MRALSDYQTEISDLTDVLSLITKRASGFEEAADKETPHRAVRSESHRLLVDNKHERVSEFEFEASISSNQSELVMLKQRALDRLAEILARFKTARGPLDAKHVTSVIMLERSDSKHIAFICAKNEGLDSEDKAFLGKLGELLPKVSAEGEYILSRE